MPTLQTFDGPTLEAVLSRVSSALGPEPRIVRADKVRRGGVAGFFAKECFEVTVAIDGDGDGNGDGEDRLAPEPAAGPPVAGPRSIIELVEEVSEAERRGPAEPVGGARSLPTSFAPSTEGRTFQEVLRGLLADTAPPPQVTDPQVLDASALGVPEALLAPGVGHSTSPAGTLLAALERLAPPPPLRAGAGDVVVVVGDPAVSAEAAACAAAELGHVPVELLAGSAAEAAAQRQAWQERLVPTVVVVGCGYDRASQQRVGTLLAVLRPVAVWGAVRADRKADDVRAWASGLGSVTALAVGACDETASPGTVLGAGIPVATVAGRRSTPAAWTALLVERLVGG